jgi:rubrerythrin
MMELYRCRICGETYLGAEAPTHCPYCGAHQDLIVLSSAFPAGINDVDPTETEAQDLEAAIDLETSNTRFYLAAATRRDNDALRSYFKRLAKVEAEHCEVFSKLLGRPEPDDLMTPSESTGSWETDIAESLERENRATNLYKTFAERATSERLREVFGAVGDVEADHIALDRVAQTYV